MIRKKCETCGKEFESFPSSKRKYCSLECRQVWNKDKSHPKYKEYVEAQRIAGKEKIKHCAGWNRGRRCKWVTKRNLENNPMKNPVSIEKMRLKQLSDEGIERALKNLPKDTKGGKNGNWRGGITPEHEKIRHNPKTKEWARSVKERDKNTCQRCGKVGKIAHHLKYFAKNPELRFDLNNGITLCKECHDKIHYNS